MDYKSLWKIIYLGEDRRSENVWYYRATSKQAAVGWFIHHVGVENFICDVFIADDDEIEAYEQGFAAGEDWESQRAYERTKEVLVKKMLDTLDDTKVPWRRKAIINLIERVAKEDE